MAFKSPPASLRTILNGQPKKAKAPIMTVIPSKNLVKGEEPPFALNSFAITAVINAPKIMPITSGLMYANLAAPCIPSAPVISLKKQAIQTPILPGLPN